VSGISLARRRVGCQVRLLEKLLNDEIRSTVRRHWQVVGAAIMASTMRPSSSYQANALYRYWPDVQVGDRLFV
jgi:hypothetical protein